MRRRSADKRKLQLDVKYKSKVVAKFINMVMERGKKSLAEKIVYQSLDIAAKRAGNSNPQDVLTKALENVRPLLEVKSRRVGGATYQVPIEVNQTRGVSLAIHWIRNFARLKKGKPMQDRLASEIFDAFKGEGSAMKKREDTHKMAEANKAFSHFRW